ncbi:MAG TPA: hypothetical protein VHE83_08230 [Mycobacteriales bacterium]|nr:hypothetical protein [Mycobacteriales bacterium]
MTHRIAATSAVAFATVVALSAPGAAAPHESYTTQVLRVGTWHGVKGNEPTIDAAMAALKPGGWLLIGPGDWHPEMDKQADQSGSDFPSAVNVTVPNVHIRGMDRNRTILDGTKAGAAPCSSRPQDQDFGAVVKGEPQGRNGPTAQKVDKVWFENFTACNFLTGSADTGNEVWWNGGDDGGKIGLHEWYGSYLTASSSYFDPAHSDTAAQYGIFVSNSSGTGSVTHAYASNMNDSSFYVGACRDCNATLDDVHAENSALGLSSTNAGGHFVVENSEWDQNKSGLVNNSQNSADPPTPQNGSCPSGNGPYGTTSCTIWRNNYVHDNNNPNVPFAGTAGFGPTGTGIILAGIRDDSLVGNRIENNGAWGVLITFFPDTQTENENNVSNCNGGELNAHLPASIGGQAVPCVFDSFSDHVVGNHFAHNGSFGNPTNGDIADLTYPAAESPGAGASCYSGNTDAAGLSTTPKLLASVQTDCSNPAVFPAVYAPQDFTLLAAEAGCASTAVISCPSGLPAVSYPQTTTVHLMAIPHDLPTMPNPCAGVPDNPWCEQDETSAPAAGSTATKGSTHATAPSGSLAATGERPWLREAALALLLAALCGLTLRRSSRRRRSVIG